jgi:hypothetical protein
MLRALGWLLAVLLLVGCGWWLYTHSGTHPVSTTGDVFPHDTSDTADDTASAPKPEPAATPVLPTPQPTEVAPAATLPPPAAATVPAALPVADSIDRNPPVGMAFGGSGKYQWYRQGDITWRIDTHSGAACIDFATMAEWAKPIVYSRGCGRT